MESVSMETTLEEGEIVDDLEDVSDCSMSPSSPLYSGKSVSPPELLSAVCLSSISPSDYSTTDGRSCMHDPAIYQNRNEVRHRQHKRRRLSEDYLSRSRCCKRSKHNHRRSVESSDSDSENVVVDPKYARKLRVALRRESSQDLLLHNSLKTRLKAFIEPGSQSEDDLSLAALRELAFSTIKTADNLNKQEGGLLSESEKQQSDCMEVKDIQEEEDGISDLELRELEEMPVILDSIDIGKKEGNEEVSKVDEINNQNDNHVLENTDDSDLNELRLAALKTFILEKHKRRKKKMAAEKGSSNEDLCVEDNATKSDLNEIDKENDKSMINNDLDNNKSSSNKNCDTEKNNEIETKEPTNSLTDCVISDKNVDDDNCSDYVKIDIEEDADILRAMLLASMSTKLANKAQEDSSAAPLERLTVSEIRKIEKSRSNQNSFTVTITKPQSLFKTTRNDISRPKNTLLNVNHSNNLKINKINEQPHCIVKPLIINVNDDSDSETENVDNENSQTLKDTVTEFLKKQRAEVEAGKTNLEESLNRSDDVLTEKSVVKLLPHSQQLEYRRLKQLLYARKKTRVKRPSQRLSESKREKVPKIKVDAVNTTTASENVNTNANVVEKKIVQPPSNLQKTLSDMQIRKNGRLQMKGKYRSLALLLNKTNQASNERRQHEIEIKKLLQQIERARIKLAASHQNFTNLVQQLLSEKNKIDKGMFKTVKPLQSNIFTSTPNKFVKKPQLSKVNSPKRNSDIVDGKNSESVNVDGVIKDNNLHLEEEHKKDDNGMNQLEENNVEQKEMLFDPNDINKVFVDQPLAELVTFPKYTSPLGSRDGINDPLTTICPYDLLGVCKDKECRYMHCS